MGLKHFGKDLLLTYTPDKNSGSMHIGILLGDRNCSVRRSEDFHSLPYLLVNQPIFLDGNDIAILVERLRNPAKNIEPYKHIPGIGNRVSIHPKTAEVYAAQLERVSREYPQIFMNIEISELTIFNITPSETLIDLSFTNENDAVLSETVMKLKWNSDNEAILVASFCNSIRILTRKELMYVLRKLKQHIAEKKKYYAVIKNCANFLEKALEKAGNQFPQFSL